MNPNDEQQSHDGKSDSEIGNRQSEIANQSLVSSDSPWPGLESFSEDAQSFFFGREQETDELSRLVRRQTLTVLFGQSGLGKSSLLKAGLFPLLRKSDYLPLYLRLDHGSAIAESESEESPTIGNQKSPIGNLLVDQVKQSLNAAFAEAKADAPAFSDDETLWEYFHRKDVDIWSARNRLLTPVLVFDQFEEIFTLGRADNDCRDRSKAFLEELACLVENRAPAAVRAKLDDGTLDPDRFNFEKPSCQVILSLREDFLPDLEGLRQEMPGLIHNRLRLKRLNGTQALEVVTGPAPDLLAEGVAEKIVEFVAGARGGSAERLAELDVEPPLLSVICRELNERRRSLEASRITADLVSGNRREILTGFYDRSVEDMPDEMREFVEDRLLTKSGFRDNLALESALEAPGVTRPHIDTLVARRLLRVEDRMGLQRVELTHDVLAEVVHNAREVRQQRLALEEVQRRDQQVLQLARRQAKRQRFAIAGLTLVVAALCVGAFYGIRSERLATDQAGRADLETGTDFLDEGKLTDGLAYLAGAAQRGTETQVVGPRLLSTLASHNFLLPTMDSVQLPSTPLGGDYLPDGQTLLLLTEREGHLAIDGGAEVQSFDVLTGKLTRTLEFDAQLQFRRSQLAPEKTGLIATVLSNDTIAIIDPHTGETRSTITIPPADLPQHKLLETFSLSPNGRWLATLRNYQETDTGESIPGMTVVFDTATGEEQFRIPGKNSINSYDHRHATTLFSRDGRLMVTSVTHDASSVPDWQRKFKKEIRSVPDGTVIATLDLPPNNTILAVEFSADSGRVLISGYRKGGPFFQVFDSATGAPVGPAILRQYNRGSHAPKLTPDGQRVVADSPDRSVRVIDVVTGGRVYTLPHNTPFWGLRLSQDGSLYVTQTFDGRIHIWDLQTGKLHAQSSFKLGRRDGVIVAPDCRSLVVITAEGRFQRYALTSGIAVPLSLPRPKEFVTLVHFSPTPPTRLEWFTLPEKRHVDVVSGQMIEGGFPLPGEPMGWFRYRFALPLRPGDSVVARYDPAPPRILTFGDQGVIRDLPLAGLTAVGESQLLLSPSTNFAVTPLQNKDTPRMLGIWDMQSGLRVGQLPRTAQNLGAFAGQVLISPDDQTIASEDRSDRSSIHLYGLPAGEHRFTIQPQDGAFFNAFEFNLDGSRLITGDSWGTLQTWDVTTGEIEKTIQAHNYDAEHLNVSEDHERLASLSMDGWTRIWDTTSFDPVGPGIPQVQSPRRVFFNADNSRIVTLMVDDSVQVWDVETGLKLGQILDNEDRYRWTVDFSPDGRFLLFMGQTVEVWATPPGGREGRAPAWLLDLVTLVAGQRLNEEGKFDTVAPTFAELERIRREIAKEPADDEYAVWARWFLSDSPDRPIAPGFTVTPAGAKKLIATINKEFADFQQEKE